MNKNFIILFNGGEGTSPLVRLLDNFEHIDVIHHDDGEGWEPFDKHNCGPLPLNDYRRCLELIYGADYGRYMQDVNDIYSKRARRPLAEFDKEKSVGFKMRFRSQRSSSLGPIARFGGARFKRVSFDLFRRHSVVVFIAIRQDVFRWALSLYHGDGTGSPGQLQFRLAAKRMTRSDISRIEVDLDSFERMVVRCESKVQRKRQLLAELRRSGISAYPLLYENFLDDKLYYLRDLLRNIGVEVSDEEIAWAVGKGTHYERVHGNDVSEFVTNADELIGRFSHRYMRWHGAG